MPTFTPTRTSPVRSSAPCGRSVRHLTVPQDNRAGADDPVVLARAAELQRAVLTKNRNDFHRLHVAMPDHSGIITITDDKDRAALALRIHAAVSATPNLDGLLIRIVRPSSPTPAP